MSNEEEYLEEEFEDTKEVVVNATIDQIEEFKISILWQDIKRELIMWKEMCKDEYGQVVGDSITTGKDISIHLGDIHGREMTIDYLLSLPDVFLQILKDKEEIEDESRSE